MGIQGNEKADIEAKKYAETFVTAATEETQTLAHARRVIRQRKDQAWLKEWKEKGTSQAMKYYQELEIQSTTNIKVMPEMKVSRKVLGWLIAARSGHGHFADYHERFGHEEEDKRCKCGQRRSRLHPFSCTNARPYRAKLFSITEKRPLTTKEVLGTTQGVKSFAEWAPRTDLFQRKKVHEELVGSKKAFLGGLLRKES